MRLQAHCWQVASCRWALIFLMGSIPRRWAYSCESQTDEVYKLLVWMHKHTVQKFWTIVTSSAPWQECYHQAVTIAQPKQCKHLIKQVCPCRSSHTLDAEGVKDTEWPHFLINAVWSLLREKCQHSRLALHRYTDYTLCGCGWCDGRDRDGEKHVFEQISPYAIILSLSGLSWGHRMIVLDH